MKTIAWLIFFLFLLHLGVQAQTIISGFVTDSLNVPIPNTCVYLSKTTAGVLANPKGFYSLSIHQAGRYELITSCVGYKSHSQIITTESGNQKINFKLSKRTFLISEITVKGKDKNRRENYDQFEKCFIGITDNSPYCTIENPKDLVVYRKSNGVELIAYSVNPLIITNSALEYKIIYDLKNFSYNFNTKHLRFSGNYYFQDISNQKRKNSMTNRNRLIAYYGSRMHFLRALFADSVREGNFEMCNIELDSCGREILTHSIHEKELRFALNTDSMTLYHFYPIFISYADNHPELFKHPNIYRPNTYTSRIAFTDTIHVYKNGYYPDCYSISWSGDISFYRIADLLPYDFVPKPTIKLNKE